MWTILSVLGTFVFVALCWIPFRAESVAQAMGIFRKLIFWSAGVSHPYTWALAAPVLLLAATLWCVFRCRDKSGVVHGELPVFRLDTFWGMLAFVLLVGFCFILMYTGANPFIYFQF